MKFFAALIATAYAAKWEPYLENDVVLVDEVMDHEMLAHSYGNYMHYGGDDHGDDGDLNVPDGNFWDAVDDFNIDDNILDQHTYE